MHRTDGTYGWCWEKREDINDDIAEGVEIKRSRNKQQKTDTESKGQMKDILIKEGLFSVKLFNLGEWIEYIKVNSFR